MEVEPVYADLLEGLVHPTLTLPSPNFPPPVLYPRDT